MRLLTILALLTVGALLAHDYGQTAIVFLYGLAGILVFGLEMLLWGAERDMERARRRTFDSHPAADTILSPWADSDGYFGVEVRDDDGVVIGGPVRAQAGASAMVLIERTPRGRARAYVRSGDDARDLYPVDFDTDLVTGMEARVPDVGLLTVNSW